MHLDRGAAPSSGLHPSTIQSVLARMADVPLGALGVTLAPDYLGSLSTLLCELQLERCQPQYLASRLFKVYGRARVIIALRMKEECFSCH